MYVCTYTEISPGCPLERLMLKLKLQYFGHLIRRADSLEKTLMLGKIKGRRRGDDRGWDGWMASLTQWTWVWVDFGIWWWTGRPGVLWFMGSQRVRHDWATELSWYSYMYVYSCTVLEIPNVQGQEQRLRFTGAAKKRYPISKVRSSGWALLGRLCGDTPRPRSEKPQ